MSHVGRELAVCLWCLYGGALIGLAYDVFRLLRLPFGKGRWKDALFDLLFYAAAGCMAGLTLFYANGGVPRLYALFSIALGAAAYLRTAGVFTARLLRAPQREKKTQI